jgi:hypothetical protein
MTMLEDGLWACKNCGTTAKIAILSEKTYVSERSEQVSTLETFSEYIRAEKQVAVMKKDLRSFSIYSKLSKAVRAAITELSNGG